MHFVKIIFSPDSTYLYISYSIFIYAYADFPRDEMKINNILMEVMEIKVFF